MEKNVTIQGLDEFSEEEIKKIFNVIDSKLREVKGKFHFPEHKEFKL